jgi:chromosome segregation protein
MRLSKLKLAGFKSFVDPTTVLLPTNLTGVVGPNGCGKSNIIDAVRWVMGEISAKHLRGNDMTDVIFNGSGGRKPVGTASVELIFDNADGGLSGPYASYAEVSLKRQVSRDGQSTYFINGARCRRKDITQLFLGTGLGSRSYAIIEQGMISRLIEAKPDDLRAFLEEAAGISKYKERRRETENRIAHTRENLDRLNDIREELDKQITRLQRQAATARRYQVLKEEERKLKAELLALRLQDLEVESVSRAQAAREREVALEAAIAALRAAEAAIEKARNHHAQEAETLAAVQAKVFQKGAEATRLEQAILHARELRARQRADLEQSEVSHAEAASLLSRDEAELVSLTDALAALEPQLDAAKVREREAAGALSVAEAAMQTWQSQWEAFTREGNEASQKAMVERARIEQLDTRLRQSLQAKERVETELEALQVIDNEAKLAQLSAAVADALAQEASSQAQLTTLLEDLRGTRATEQTLQSGVDAARSELSRARGQVVSLEALQQAALGQVKGQVVDWLAGHSLGGRPRLGQALKVDAGWSRAVETVLGGYLEAVCVDGLDAITSFVDSLTVGQVTFVGGSGQHTAGATGQLLSKVKGPKALEQLMAGVQIVEHLDEALARRASLGAGESVITRDGVWIGSTWLRVSRDQDQHAGVLEREQELLTRRQAVIEAESALQAKEHALLAARERITGLERARDAAQEAANRLHRAWVDVSGQLNALKARQADGAARTEQLKDQVTTLAAEIQSAEEETRQARGRLEEAIAAMQGVEDRRPDFEANREMRREALTAARLQADEARRVAQESAIAVGSRRSTLQSLNTSLERVCAQLEQLTLRRSELQQELAAGEAPLAASQRDLETALGHKLEAERELSVARVAVETAESQFKAVDAERLGAEAAVEAERYAANSAVLSAQETRVRRESLLEQFALTRLELSAVIAGLPPEAVVATWDEQVVEVEGKIERLGQVNLAAIDEFKEQSERKDYIDQQFNDLTEALNTLEQAIRKIDRETKERFQDTFDKVNTGLKEKFPRLFGGGNAYLELTSDDVLEAGVAIMARPPGKRNSTISQLSGGEKALTAVALVFSIFELNPAPFCLLDEVDAPLDENNVGRFCDIVKDMSERVQFLFVTHNKNTMELARQLLGVTMNEPGVSRLVSVDVDEALRMAAAG